MRIQEKLYDYKSTIGDRILKDFLSHVYCTEVLPHKLLVRIIEEASPYFNTRWATPTINTYLTLMTKIETQEVTDLFPSDADFFEEYEKSYDLNKDIGVIPEKLSKKQKKKRREQQESSP